MSENDGFPSASASSSERPRAHVDLLPIVTLTSVLTETVYPTWVFTETVTPSGETTVSSTLQSSLGSRSTETTRDSQVVMTEEQTMSPIIPSTSPITVSESMQSPTDSPTTSTGTPRTSAKLTSSALTPQTQGVATPFTSPIPAQSSESSDLFINPWLSTSTGETSSTSTSGASTAGIPTPSTSSPSPSAGPLSSLSDLETSSTTESSVVSPLPSQSPTESLVQGSLIPTTTASTHQGTYAWGNSASTSFTQPLAASSTSPLTSSSTSSQIPDIVAGSTTSSNNAPSHHVNKSAIIGGSIGGAAFAIIVIVACCLFFRRRRRNPQAQHTNNHQRLLSNDSITSFHHRHSSQPIRSLTNEMSCAPTAPRRRYSNPPALHSSLMRPSSLNPRRPLDRTHVYDEERDVLVDDPFADPDDDLISPLFPKAPTSNSVSNYSRSTLRGSRNFSENFDTPLPSSQYQNSQYLSQSTLNLPNEDSPVFKYPITPKRHSDPFDLEPPPAAVQKPSPLNFWKFRN